VAITYIFGDESGNFHFTHDPHGSRYFLVCTIAMKDCGCAADLLTLRRDLIWRGEEVGDCFHASEDKQKVRDAVFAAIKPMNFTVQATLLEKSKAQPQLRVANSRFYHYAWFYHWSYVAPKVLQAKSDALITTARMLNGKKQAVYTHAINDSLAQTTRSNWKTHFCLPPHDPCLQIADYCAWALYKKWESGGKELRPYNEIAEKVTHEADMFKRGTVHHY
jgi:hypothetical protein